MNKKEKAGMLLATMLAMTGQTLDEFIDQAMNDPELKIELKKMKIKETEDV
jgi:hypothetical protein